MRRLMLAIYIFLSASFSTRSSTVIPLDTIKINVVSFLKEVENFHYSPEDLDYLIMESKSKEIIKENEEGVYFFNMLCSGLCYTHFILIEKDRFQIINMTDPLDQNILKFISFFGRNNIYSREDILYYISDFVIHYQRDNERIKNLLIFPESK